MIKAVKGNSHASDHLPRRILLIWLAATVPFRMAARAQPGPIRGPMIDLWRKVRNALTAEGGEGYFPQIKHAEIPPGGMFDGTVVSQSSPTDLVINVDNAAGDATLTFRHSLKGVVPGTLIHFRGVVESYRKEPYMLKLWFDDEDVHGLADSK